MTEFLDFLKHNKRWWVPPIVVFFALLIYLAWKVSQTPESPFEYREY